MALDLSFVTSEACCTWNCEGLLGIKIEGNVDIINFFLLGLG